MKKQGQTYFFDSPARIIGHAGVAGKKEGEGPLGKEFDVIFEDTSLGQDSYEMAESAMLHDAFIRALSNADISPQSVNAVMCGDLLDQCVGSCFALKDLEMPFIGMYGACSTMALTLCNACFYIESGVETVMDVCRRYPMMAEYQVVIVKEAQATLHQAKDNSDFLSNTADSVPPQHSGQ